MHGSVAAAPALFTESVSNSDRRASPKSGSKGPVQMPMLGLDWLIPHIQLHRFSLP
jgi:hypothetical protein